MNQGVRGRALMKKTRGKISLVSVPLKVQRTYTNNGSCVQLCQFAAVAAYKTITVLSVQSSNKIFREMCEFHLSWIRYGFQNTESSFAVVNISNMGIDGSSYLDLVPPPQGALHSLQAACNSSFIMSPSCCTPSLIRCEYIPYYSIFPELLALAIDSSKQRRNGGLCTEKNLISVMLL